MKRMFYVSRFARQLTKKDLADIHETALRNNRREQVTGFLVCLGDAFFQLLEGPAAAVDRLYHDRIVPDVRHRDVFCVKVERGVKRRMFPDWNMRVFNLNEEREALPIAFREMLTALLESSHTIAQYTQPSVFELLKRGVNPTSVRPRRRRVTVLYSDIIGFSFFSEQLRSEELIALVNSHIEVCTQCVSRQGGEVNKLTGDGLLAYFTDRTSDPAIESAVGILTEMKRRRARAQKHSPQRLLYGGVGLANGLVYEGNIGFALKRDFTVLGNTVNLASRLESLTRDLNVRLTLSPSIVPRAKDAWPFVSLGRQQLKGQSRAIEIFSLGSLSRLNVSQLYGRIGRYVQTRRT
jgi:class 3 adenylate cyclase